MVLIFVVFRFWRIKSHLEISRIVAIVHCSNGKSRTGLAIACYLRYAGIFDNTLEAFEYFVNRRSPSDKSWVSVTQNRYLQYFENVVMGEGEIPQVCSSLQSPFCQRNPQ